MAVHQTSQEKTTATQSKNIQNTNLRFQREQLREQHELTQEIGNAITSMPITEPIDEDELENELADMEQEKLNERMLDPGTVPVADNVGKMPNAVQGEGESCTFAFT